MAILRHSSQQMPLCARSRDDSRIPQSKTTRPVDAELRIQDRSAFRKSQSLLDSVAVFVVVVLFVLVHDLCGFAFALACWLDAGAGWGVGAGIEPQLACLGGGGGDACLLGVAFVHPLGEALDRSGVHPLLAEVLAGDVDVGALPGAAHRDVGVLPVGLPAAHEDTCSLRGEALSLPDVYRVAEAEIGELAGVELHLPRLGLPGADAHAVLLPARIHDRPRGPVLHPLLPG